MTAKLTASDINARIADRGIVMVGEYVRNITKTEFRCSEGHEWMATPDNVMRGTGCPHCAGRAPLTAADINARLADRGIVMVGEYVRNITKTEFRCSEGHEWMATPGNVMRGGGCPHCFASSFHLTAEIVNARIASRGIVMVGEFQNVKSKASFRCRDGHEWAARPDSVFYGSGCPSCASFGFDQSAPAAFYAGLVSSPVHGDLVKPGISNKGFAARYSAEQTSIALVAEWRFPVGADAARLERQVLAATAALRVTTDGDVLSRGGATELRHASALDTIIAMATEFAAAHGGVLQAA